MENISNFSLESFIKGFFEFWQNMENGVYPSPETISDSEVIYAVITLLLVGIVSMVLLAIPIAFLCYLLLVPLTDSEVCVIELMGKLHVVRDCYFKFQIPGLYKIRGKVPRKKQRISLKRIEAITKDGSAVIISVSFLCQIEDTLSFASFADTASSAFSALMIQITASIQNVVRTLESSSIDTVIIEGQMRRILDRNFDVFGVSIEKFSVSLLDESLAHQTDDVIEQYYSGEQASVKECKVIFLGDGAAGKSSLIERMVNGQFVAGSLPTDGVNTTFWQQTINEENYKLRILDFGGQEIMHSMHRCFLTAHTVYVVVCESRDDTELDSAAARWLETVNSFAPGCPVILALNKADLNANVSVNERDLKQRNPALKLVLKTSALNEPDSKYGVNRLIAAIRDEIPGTVNDYKANADMLGVKLALEDMTDDYISSERYREICAQHHITDEKLQYDMLGFFRDLGVTYYYESNALDTRLESVRVLNPEWLTNGIYRLILRTPESGFLRHTLIKDTLRATHPGDVHREITYSPEETEFILHVMRYFEISHDMGNGVEMIPLKMSKTPPDSVDEFHKENALHLRWEGTYLPNNLIHRLLIRKFSELDTKCVWRTGGHFRQTGGGCEALAEMNEKALDVYVNGQRDCRQYLETFRGVIQDILNGLNLKTSEMICHTVNGQEGKVSYQAALQHLYLHKEEIYLDIGEFVSPVMLLKEIYVDVDKELERYRQRMEHGASRIVRKQSEKAKNLLDDKKTRTEIKQSQSETTLNRIKICLFFVVLVIVVISALRGQWDKISKYCEPLISLMGG